jgi:benzoyl-CoA reductase subunit D
MNELKRDKQHLTCGIDVGTSSVKVTIAASNAGADGELLATTHQRIRRRNVRDVVAATYQEACASIDCQPSDFDYICTTGDADEIDFATGHLYGMTTHARGALFLVPEARAALDLGALHSRSLKFDDRGRVLHQRMTSQCASGTGQFLESIARYLGVPLEDVGPLSIKADETEECSSICAVLAETDVINMVARGVPTEGILKGIHLSIARRLTKLLRAIGARGTVALTGGLAHDKGLALTINQVLAAESKKKRPGIGHIEVTAHPEAIHAGAIGAALLGAYRCQQLAERQTQPAATNPGAATAASPA